MRADGKTNKQKATDMSLSKLSVVKRPAQEGALAAIIKGSAITDEQVEKETFMDSLNQIMIEEEAEVLFSTVWDMQYALRNSIRNTIEDSQITNKKEVIQANITDFATALSGIIASTSIIKTGGKTMGKEKTTEELITEAVGPIQKKLDIAESVAKMDDQTKAYYNSLDDSGKDSFLKMSDDDQGKLIKEAVDNIAKNDETFESGGGTIRKSEVGETVFKALKDSKTRADNAEKIAKEERDKRELQDFSKTAEATYGNLPGSTDEKGAVLKAIDGLSEVVQKTLEGMLKAGNEGIDQSNLYKEIGDGSTPTVGTAEEKLNKMAKEKAEKDSMTVAKAYDAILKTTEGSELYQKSLTEKKV